MNALYYNGTNTAVLLGDSILVRRLFGRRVSATVVYVPGQSKKNSNIEAEDVSQWAYRVKGEERIWVLAYYPEQQKYAPRKISFLERGAPTDSIGPDEVFE